jgi:hypothetical protein
MEAIEKIILVTMAHVGRLVAKHCASENCQYWMGIALLSILVVGLIGFLGFEIYKRNWKFLIKVSCWVGGGLVVWTVLLVTR